jgi:hypothetical protein
MAARSTPESTALPRSRWGRRSLAAAKTLPATPRVETGEGGAACRAADADRSFIDGTSESGNGTNRSVLSLGPHRLKSVPAGLSLFDVGHENCPALVGGPGFEGNRKSRAGRPEPPRVSVYSAAMTCGCGSSVSPAVVSSSSPARNSGSVSASPSSPPTCAGFGPLPLYRRPATELESRKSGSTAIRLSWACRLRRRGHYAARRSTAADGAAGA